MVKDNNNNCWEFQASVWDAAQQQPQQRRPNEVQEEETPGSSLLSQDSLDEIDDDGETTQQFQMTDLPHPDWGEVVYSMNTDAYT